MHVSIFLASGRILQAALKDNVFSVAFSQAELPGRIVGYDGDNRVAGIVELPGNSVLTPCPRPELTKPISQLPAPEPWERVDLGRLTVNGKRILGMTPAQVKAALGQPDLVRPHNQTVNGVPIPAFRYGGSRPSTMGLEVTFAKHQDRIYANGLFFQSPSVVDATLGHVLRLDPARLQRKIEHAYGSRYRTFLGYGSNPQRGCTATLKSRGAASGISFGLNPYRPSRPYLTIQANAAG